MAPVPIDIYLVADNALKDKIKFNMIKYIIFIIKLNKLLIDPCYIHEFILKVKFFE